MTAVVRLATALLVPCSALAQVPVRSLEAPAAEFSEPFSQIAGVRELGDGRVLVSDAREIAVRLVDLRRGVAQQVGREGQGPGEYRRPLDLWPLRGDSTLLFDAGNRRVLVLDGQGRPVATRSARFSPSAGVTYTLRPRGVDHDGRLYVQVADPGADSLPILRFLPGAGGVDTLAYTARPMYAESGQRSGNVQVRVAQPAPFTPRDAWAVAGDGAVVVARAGEYRVEWHRLGAAPVFGPAITYQPVPVTDADREAWRASMARGGMPALSVRQGRAPGDLGRGNRVSVPEPPVWPSHKPAFVDASGRVAPNGRLWLERHRPAAESRPRYDVFDGTGRLIEQVLLPAGTRLVGFGLGSVWLARVTSDGLEYLQRHPMP